MLWIVDHNLADFVGHYFSYAAALCEAARGRGVPTTTLARRDVIDEIRSTLHAEPTFRFGHHDGIGAAPHRRTDDRQLETNASNGTSKAPRLAAQVGLRGVGLARRVVRRFASVGLDAAWASRVFLEDFDAATRGRLQPGDVVFMPTVDHRQFGAWSQWLRRPDTRDIRVVLMVRYNFADPDRPADLPGRSIRRRFDELSAAAAGRDVVLATDSERLQDEYRRFSDLPIEVFPIPHVPAANEGRDAERPAPDAPLRLISLGDAREEKGWPLLVQAIERLHSSGELNQFDFALQCPITHPVHEPMRRWNERLSALNSPRVTLVDRLLDRVAYEDLLKSSHGVVLPYRRRVYYARTSGPVVEAIAAGRPVVVPEDTWLSDQTTAFDTGLTFRDGDVESLVGALRRLRSEYAVHAARAADASLRWRSFHNPETFLGALLGNAA